ncbi:hypothetical protein HZB90_01190 [archaeon]|nr:hypothetical protein [archaeon]
MKEAVRNIIVKFTQQQAMNQDFQGERVFDAVAIQKPSPSAIESPDLFLD